MDTMISYLIPSYNHESFLPLMLQSIKSDIEHLDVASEVIIVDDGSTDNSSNIIKAWVDENSNFLKIKYILQENKGINAVLNLMIEQANGVFLRLCSSDDVIKNGSTQILYNEFKHKPSLVCALADAKIINEHGHVIHESSITYHGGTTKRLENPSSLVKELILNWCIAGPSHLIRRKHYEHLLYDESSKIDDFDLFLSLLEKPGGIRFINETVCFYRVHPENTCKTSCKNRRIENINFFSNIIDKYINRGRLTPYLTPLKYKTKAKIYFLKKHYFKCFLSLSVSLLFRLKNGLGI